MNVTVRIKRRTLPVEHWHVICSTCGTTDSLTTYELACIRASSHLTDKHPRTPCRNELAGLAGR